RRRAAAVRAARGDWRRGAPSSASAGGEGLMFERSSIRVNPRTPVRVEIGRPGQPTALRVVSNISHPGARVGTGGDFPIAQARALDLGFSPELEPFQAAGRVIWIRPAGEVPGAQRYGLQWAHRTGPQHARLRELISAEL